MLSKAQRKILGGRVYANPGCMFLGNGSAICKNMSAVQENCCVFVYNVLRACAQGTAVRCVKNLGEKVNCCVLLYGMFSGNHTVRDT